LLEQQDDKSAALRCYRKMLANLKNEQGEDFLNGTREAARLLHEKDQLSQGYDDNLCLIFYCRKKNYN
jgi:hypothetical protein